MQSCGEAHKTIGVRGNACSSIACRDVPLDDLDSVGFSYGLTLTMLHCHSNKTANSSSLQLVFVLSEALADCQWMFDCTVVSTAKLEGSAASLESFQQSKCSQAAAICH